MRKNVTNWQNGPWVYPPFYRVRFPTTPGSRNQLGLSISPISKHFPKFTSFLHFCFRYLRPAFLQLFLIRLYSELHSHLQPAPPWRQSSTPSLLEVTANSSPSWGSALLRISGFAGFSEPYCFSAPRPGHSSTPVLLFRWCLRPTRVLRPTRFLRPKVVLITKAHTLFGFSLRIRRGDIH